MNEITVDARGRSCPEPVLMTKKAIQEKHGSYRIMVDNKTAVENVTRFLNNMGFKPEIIEDGEEFTIIVRQK